MKIHVVFEFPDVKDVDSDEADAIVTELMLDLKHLPGWYIDDVTE